eukprot:m51a1_g9946 hypothetical protein (105) ;mRNA; r:18389-18703
MMGQTAYRRVPSAQAAPRVVHVRRPDVPPPVGAICRGVALLVVGALLVLGSLLSHHYGVGNDRVVPMAVAGSLLAIPGAYISALAFYAWRGREGYTYDLIPDMQ